MTLSTAIKEKMLRVRDLAYHTTLEIKNDSGTWIDFTDRDPVISKVRLSTERIPNKIVSSVSDIIVDNEDRYFDYMDDPSDSTTASLFGTKASGFASGFPGREVRLGLKMALDDGSFETAYLGIYVIDENIQTDISSGKARIPLRPDIWLLKEAGTDNLSDGERHYENRPISYLVREILKKVYPAGIGTSFDVPGRIYLDTSDGEPALSHYGKPPERDTTGRWRTDIEEKPGPIYYHSDNGRFYVGVGDYVWEWDPTTEEWDLSGNHGTVVKGIYRMSASRLLVVGWDQDFGLRGLSMTTSQILTTSNSLTNNDPGYNSTIWTGELVLRDTRVSGFTTRAFGRQKNNPRVAGDSAYGRNMPVPFPQAARLAIDNGTNPQTWGYPADSQTGEIASGDWTDYNPSDDPHDETFLEAGYWASYIGSTGIAAGDWPGGLIYWGHKANLAYAASTNNFSGPYLFAAETDGNPMGVNLTGTIDIVCYTAYSGTNSTITTASLTGADAPIYDLRYFGADGTNDDLYWIDVDWKENRYDSAGAPPTDSLSNLVPAEWNIKRGRLSDDGSGGPELDTSSDITTLWTSGDNLFAVDDSEYAPISVLPFRRSSSTEFIVQIFKTDSVGSACFELYYVNSSWSSATKLGSAIYFGWGNLTLDAGSAVYAVERDTGRIIKIDISSGAPTDYTYVQGGDEPVPGAYYEAPNPEGLIVTTESSKTCLYGISHPYLPSFASEGEVAYNGKYYLWKYHIKITDRVALFEEDKYNAFDALGLLANAVNYQVGMDPDGTGFFKPIPASSGTSLFTIDTESAVSRYFDIVKYDGTRDIRNRAVFIPYEALAREPEGSLLLNGYTDDGNRYTFNGEMEVRTETSIEKNITLHCIAGGSIGTAEFKYIEHKYKVQTALMEDVNPATLDEIEVDNLNDVSAGMFVQVGNFEGADPHGAPLEVSSIAADGTITLSEDLDSAYPEGTIVIFRDAKDGKWSSDYDTPDTFTTSTSWAEIGDTALFLKFTEDTTPRDFAVGDRIEIYNPGMKLEKSRTKKYLSEDSDSIANYGLREFNIDNPFMAIALGKERGRLKVASDAEPHHLYKIRAPLLLEAVPLALITLRSESLLPTATDYEEVLYIQEVSHSVNKAETEIIARAADAYR